MTEQPALAGRLILPSRRVRSIASYLLMLAAVTLIPSFVFAGILMQRNHVAQEATLETLIVSTTRSLVQAVERELGANITTLRVLATTPSLAEGDYRGFYDRLKLALAGSGANVFVLNEDLSTLLSTRLDFDAEQGRTSDPQSARRALDADEIVVTDLVFGAQSNQWVYNILMPVDLPDGERKVLAFNQEVSNLALALLTNRMPDGWNVALLDNRGRHMASSFGAGVVGEAFAPFDAMNQPFAPGWQRVAVIDQTYQTVIQRSALSGWRLVAWAPVAVISKPLIDAVLSLVAGGIILAALVLAGLFWVSRRIAGSVRGLARDAKRLGHGETVNAKPYPVREIAEVSTALAEASAQRQSAEAEVRFLMREVAHRSKNQMTVISAMAKQTARGEHDVAHYVQSFEKRIMGLARSTDLLLTHGRTGVELKELITHQVAPFGPTGGERVSIDGDFVRLNAQAAQTIGMAAHELSTNAAKYGAFSDGAGRLCVNWTINGETLDFVWREHASRAPATGDHKGFGTTVLTSMMARGLNAEVERIVHPDGLEWRFAIPLVGLHPDYGARALDDAGDPP